MSLKQKSPTFPKFKLGILGGTFDHLHAGHQAFLEKGFNVCQKIIIGLTSEDFTKSKLLPGVVLPFRKRKEELEQFLKGKGFLEKTKIVRINDPFPSKIFNPRIDCLIITKKTEKNAKILNLKRIKKHLPPLKIVNVPIVVNKQGECLSSEKIRLGKMDKKGEVFVEERFFKKIFLLPRKIRLLLKKPLGKLIPGSEKDLQEAASKIKKSLKDFSPTLLVAVGDIVTLSLVKEGVIPDLSIVDFKVKRKIVYQNIAQLGFSFDVKVKEAINEAGTLNPDLFEAIKSSLSVILIRQLADQNLYRFQIKPGMTRNSQLVIKVLGEEDLAALPAVLLAPLNSLVCYGQPEEGIVVIKVTEQKKEEIRKVLYRFRVKDR